VAIVFPNESIARRWDGALQARIRRAPLEGFLRTQAIAAAAPGIAQDSDNLIRATVFIVEHAMLGRLACLTSRSLAALIVEPARWRTAALVSTARLLSPCSQAR
jgi:hypothetical protein